MKKVSTVESRAWLVQSWDPLLKDHLAHKRCQYIFVCVCVCVCVCVRARTHMLSRSVLSYFFAVPWTVACQARLSLGFPRQEYWSGLLFSSPGESFQPRDRTCIFCIADGFLTTEPPGEPYKRSQNNQNGCWEETSHLKMCKWKRNESYDITIWQPLMKAEI